MRNLALAGVILAALAAGLAFGQSKRRRRGQDFTERLAGVRREVKVIDIDTAITRVPALVERERQYGKLLEEIRDTAQRDRGGLKELLQRGRQMKLDALKDLNEILKLHRGKFTGLEEKEVWSRLASARFENVHYAEEWLVNILDDLEESCRINIEMDARVYKFDTVSFDFEKTSARAMLQMMGDSLLYEWIVRGDTLYVYKESHEILFGGEYLARKKRAWRARKKALEAARKEAERRAREGKGGDGK